MISLLNSVPHVSEIEKVQQKLLELKAHFIVILMYLRAYDGQDSEKKKNIIQYMGSFKAEIDTCMDEIKSRLSLRGEINILTREAKNGMNKIENHVILAQRIQEQLPRFSSQMNPKTSYIDFRKDKFKETLQNVISNSNFIISSKALANINGSGSLKIKCFSILWNTFFLSHIYVLSDKATKKYKIIDIVCTNNQDHGEDLQDCLIEAKTIFDNVRGDLSSEQNIDETQRNLQIFLFNLNRGRLIFKPSTVLYQKFTNWIRYMYFRKRIEINLENLIKNYIKPYKEILIPEEETMVLGKRKRKCFFCQEKMKFINLKEGFVPPTIYIHSSNRYYHDKCYYLDHVK